MSDEEVSAFEDEYNIKLPKEYKFFLMNYMEGYINDDYRFPIIEKSVITPVDGFCSIDFLYVGNFIKEAKKYIFNYGRKTFLSVFLSQVIYFVWECKKNGMARFIIGIMKMKVRGKDIILLLSLLVNLY